MVDLQERLQKGRNGHAVLFCGAGLTADCLNFEEDSALGVTFHLLNILNHELQAAGKQSGFKDIRNAAKKFRTEIGNHRLMELLKSRFKLKSVSASISDIVGYPWSAIYTTNYDNGLEIAMQNAGKKFTALNNLEEPNHEVAGTPIIHLHGYAEDWTSDTFERSCVLDADSYHRLSGLEIWLDRLRFDIERAEVVVFLGFSASDFHLSEVFFNASGIRRKSFFINRETSSPDLDERAVQEDFGVPMYIGREAFAQSVTMANRGPAPTEPSLASFRRFHAPKPGASVPPVLDIENLFIWGKVELAHLKRDLELQKSDYHVLRDRTQKVSEMIAEPGRVVLVSGEICDGKSLLILDVMNSAIGSRPIFELQHPYSDLLDEASKILSAHPDALIILENCFSIHEDRLLGLGRLVAASQGSMILSARSVSTEGESGKLKGLRLINTFEELSIGKLGESEIDALISLIAQIAGWRDYQAFTEAERRRFVQRECNGSIPSVLLHLLQSKYVQERYREEYQKTSHLDVRDRHMVIAALLISNIGYDAPVSFISNLFEKDFGSVLGRMAEELDGLRLVRIEGDRVRTVPSVGSRNLLRHVIGEHEIVDTTIEILEGLAESIRRSDFEQHVFAQLMRYSILSSSIESDTEINRFFDHISKINHFREMPLFWLQWHMAMCAQKRWLNAEKYLEMGYTAADAYEKRRGIKYHRKQLDDRQAKFLAARVLYTERGDSDNFRDLNEALEIMGRIMRDEELSHHPYETLVEIMKSLEARSGTIIAAQRDILEKKWSAAVALAERRTNMVTEGYPRSRAESSLEQVKASAWQK